MNLPLNVTKNINFHVTSHFKNKSNFKLKVQQIVKLNRYPYFWTILVCYVESGSLNKGRHIKIQFENGNHFFDYAENIQVKKINVSSAKVGDLISIKILTNYEELLRLNKLVF